MHVWTFWVYWTFLNSAIELEPYKCGTKRQHYLWNCAFIENNWRQNTYFSNASIIILLFDIHFELKPSHAFQQNDHHKILWSYSDIVRWYIILYWSFFAQINLILEKFLCMNKMTHWMLCLPMVWIHACPGPKDLFLFLGR